MLQKRIIPSLLLHGSSLVKTIRFDKYQYIGDPCNTVRIFNELEVDELAFLDIRASKDFSEPNYELLADISNECFMPLSYGGGIKSLDQAKKIFDIGFEKVIVNSQALLNPKIITDIAKQFGSQAVISSIDYKKPFYGKPRLYNSSKKVLTKIDPIKWAKEMELHGAGEILFTSVDREGTWSGLDNNFIIELVDAVNIPVIAHGGVGKIGDIKDIFLASSISAVALGSLVVFQKKGMGVLVNFPDITSEAFES